MVTPIITYNLETGQYLIELSDGTAHPEPLPKGLVTRQQVTRAVEDYLIRVVREQPTFTSRLAFNDYKLYHQYQNAIRLARYDASFFQQTVPDYFTAYKGWDHSDDGHLISYGRTISWPWLTPLTAECSFNHHPSPDPKCSCGIYAARTLEQAIHYGQIQGKVALWGKFIEGSVGLRAQFAYPLELTVLKEHVTPEIMEGLQRYRVPIYVNEPVKIYNPEEDGYEHRGNEEDWSCGASEDTDPSEGSEEGS